MKRRTFLLTALAGTGALALGVNLYHPPHVGVIKSLDRENRLLFSVLIPVLLDGALPQTESLRLAAQNRTLDAITNMIEELPRESRDELGQLIELLESRLGLLLLTGNMTPLLLRSPQALAEMLETWRSSYLDMMVLAYQGLRELVIASYYACPEHWSQINYEKPQLFT
ncbi:TAT leader-containing periplasmic protein [Shewanella sp. Isolate11]|uniref:TAT leader-containing periplasmic protein n=1 Tax=Shewanella sp. Isolate11 TaxID=2908530 RepID=UPI001EFEAA90|nr:TAT leader-containing periplasmic protein [Shewanella sp. Isolate11]MCG9697530.1 TAT leader-containing periplasmic protein [Shewanella sp. Isolate11]